MPKYVGVHFNNGGKVYHFLAEDHPVKNGDAVIVETAHGIEFGEAVSDATEFDPESGINPTRKVIRVATKEDIAKNEVNKVKERDALRICEKKVAAHKLEMKLIEASYTFDGSKVLFFFTADGRVDFRELVKDLASTFKTRIELRQVGVRDEAKMLGGFGICGKPFCCTTFLSDFQPVSIKMAKEQGLSMNPAKISGTCGRLMCCLKYEQAAYEELNRITPRVGSVVRTPEGNGVVDEVFLVSGKLNVKLDKNREGVSKQFRREEVTLLRAPASKREEVPKELLNLEK
ncbi:MAG: stage 0 sporulation family protein [Clostridia bacterium]|nr:stage 0 sporulation family protein [Clostridia bacterium]